MPPRAALLPALAAVAAIMWAAFPAVGGPAATRADADPLEVTIDALSPSTVPEQGPVVVTGRVTNTDTQTWRAVRVYALTSAVPITTSDDLATASETDAGVQVGERITAEGTFDGVGGLSPGETATYSLRIPRADLGIGDAPGVYWFGIHALGETDAGRDTLADGRARTFLPLVQEGETIDAALVVSVRHLVRHAADGAIRGTAGWVTDMGIGGSLDAVTAFAAAAGVRPLTWLIDPAVTDAAARLAAGNPPRDLGPTIVEEPEEPSSSASGDASDGASGSAAPEDGSRAGEAPPDSEATTGERIAARVAAGWLARTRQAVVGDEVLALPYGDVDIAGAADSDPGIIRLARERSGREIPELRVITSPVVAAPDGYLDMAAIGLVPRGTTVLLSDRMLGVGAPTVAQVYGHRAVLASTRVTAGGPGPDDPAGPVALRQRLLSEAALGVLADRESLVAAFLGYEDLALSPAGASEFFAGLDVDWLRLTTLRAVSREAGEVERNTDPAYPEAAADAELPGANFVAARGLINAGDRLDALLPDNDTVGRQVLGEALAGVSFAVRPTPVEGAATAERSTAAIGSLMRRVTIEAPPSVTLSSDTGTFSATLSNGLDEVVLVRVQADTDEGLEIEPSEPVELGPEEQATVLMEAHSSVLGIHEVDLTVTDAEGNPVGGQASFPLRAAQVSDVIWIVWAVGAALLFGAIAVRLFRRIRGHAAGRKAHP